MLYETHFSLYINICVCISQNVHILLVIETCVRFRFVACYYSQNHIATNIVIKGGCQILSEHNTEKSIIMEVKEVFYSRYYLFNCSQCPTTCSSMVDKCSEPREQRASSWLTFQICCSLSLPQLPPTPPRSATPSDHSPPPPHTNKKNQPKNKLQRHLKIRSQSILFSVHTYQTSHNLHLLLLFIYI